MSRYEGWAVRWRMSCCRTLARLVAVSASALSVELCRSGCDELTGTFARKFGSLLALASLHCRVTKAVSGAYEIP